tara:strand:+ start:432 stop:1157 length:726 start_codon:yes stop_codon:yes gene_type:complete
MASIETPIENSSTFIEKASEPLEAAEKVPVYKKKDFVFTEKRKANLVRANKARKENNDFKKQLKLKYDEATQDLHKLYEEKLTHFLAEGELKTEEPSETTEMSQIRVESVMKGGAGAGYLPKEKNIRISDAQDSESSEEPPVRGSKKSAKSKKSKKRVKIQESSSSESSSEDEAALRREIKLRKKAQLRKKAAKYISSDSEDEAPRHSSRHPGADHAASNSNKSSMYMPNYQVGQNSGCHF